MEETCRKKYMKYVVFYYYILQINLKESERTKMVTNMSAKWMIKKALINNNNNNVVM